MFGYIKKAKDSFYEGLHSIDITDTEEKDLYAIANAELNSDERDAGLWAKAIAKGNGNTDGKYIEYRVSELKAALIAKKEYQLEVYEAQQAAKAEREKTAKEEQARIHKIEEVKKKARADMWLVIALLVVFIPIVLMFVW